MFFYNSLKNLTIILFLLFLIANCKIDVNEINSDTDSNSKSNKDIEYNTLDNNVLPGQDYENSQNNINVDNLSNQDHNFNNQSLFGTFNINDEDVFTNSTDVVLNIYVNNAFKMRFANDLDEIINSDWVDYLEVYNWQITANEGEQTVYGEFKNSMSDDILQIKDLIFLDKTAPFIKESEPLNGDIEVNAETSGIKFFFSEVLNKDSIINNILVSPNFEFEHSFIENEMVLTLNPLNFLLNSTEYTISFNENVVDPAGNSLQGNKGIKFITLPSTDLENACETGEIGDFTAVVYNSDVDIRYWSSISRSRKSTCNLKSAVYLQNPVQTSIRRSQSLSAGLLQLRLESKPLDLNFYTQNPLNNLLNSGYNSAENSYGKSKVSPDDFIIGNRYRFSGEEYTLKQKREHCFVWLRTEDDHGRTGSGGDIEDDDENNDGVSLSNYADYFNDHSWIDITENFTSTEGWYFGNLPNDIVHILFKDMGDSPAGYFSDFRDGSTIYINTIVAQNNTVNNYGEINPLFTEGTLIHELQHLAHAQAGGDLDLWLNEVLASAAESIWAGQTGIYLDYFNQNAQSYSEVSLVLWEGIEHRDTYAIGAIFGIWLAYQVAEGDDLGVFFRALYDNMSSYNDSIENLVNTAKLTGIYNTTGNLNSEAEIKKAWATIWGRFLGALLKNDTDGKYSFNGAWENLQPVTPDTSLSILPEVFLSEPEIYNLAPSSFIFVKVNKNIEEIDDYIEYQIH